MGEHTFGDKNSTPPPTFSSLSFSLHLAIKVDRITLPGLGWPFYGLTPSFELFCALSSGNFGMHHNVIEIVLGEGD